MTPEHLETSILIDVVTRFTNLRESTSRRSLSIKYQGHPVWQAVTNLTNQVFLRRTSSSTSTEQESYLPNAAAFQFCGDAKLREQAKFATTIVLHVLKQMYVGEEKREGFVFDDLKKHVADVY